LPSSDPQLTPTSAERTQPSSRTQRVGAHGGDVWTEERGSEAAAKLRAALANAPVLVFAVGRDGLFTLADGRGPAALGFTARQMVGRSALELYREIVTTDTLGRSMSGADAVHRALGGAEFNGQCTIGDAVIDLRLLPQVDETSGEILGVVGVATDVTSHARAEAILRDARERLVVADRLAAIGMLAAGAAHEINNPLTYALINIAHVRRQLRARMAPGPSADVVEEDPEEILPLVRSLEHAENGMERVRGVVRNLLTFSQGTAEQRTLVDMRGVLESSIQMVLHEIVHRARIVREFGEVPPVDANEAALGQVFLNLLVNAAQALPEGDGRAHEVRVKAYTDRDGNGVVEVADTGVGISADVLPRIFEPFFTTKAVGGGTGLGLSISYGTVTRFGGVIEVTSEVGRGTCFRVVLPPAERWRRPIAGSVAPRFLRRRSVLVIDDDALVGDSLARALEAEADVEVMTDGAQALARLVGGERWDLILCDLMMPGVSGMDVYAEAVRRAPDVARRILFMNAGAFTPRARAFVESVGDRCFDKPIDAEKVREFVRRGMR
jgi:PAS domain S-box-containing protein